MTCSDHHRTRPPEVMALPPVISSWQSSSPANIRLYGGFHNHGGTPTAGWFYFMENPNLKWMMTRGYPCSWKLPYLNGESFGKSSIAGDISWESNTAGKSPNQMTVLTYKWDTFRGYMGWIQGVPNSGRYPVGLQQTIPQFFKG